MPKLIRKTTAVPAGFGNTSPSGRGAMSRDPLRLAILSIAAIAAVTFLGSMIAVLLMHAPRFPFVIPSEVEEFLNIIWL